MIQNDSYEKGEVDFIEIGLKTNNPFLDGILIKDESNLKMQVKYFSMDDLEIDPSKIIQHSYKIMFSYVFWTLGCVWNDKM